MSAHIAHATATFAELSLAMSIAMLTKIINSPPIIDSLARETTLKRLETGETWFVKKMFQVSCAISDGFRDFFSYSAPLSFLLAVASLLGLALCPIDSPLVALLVFSLAFSSFMLISFYVYSARKVLAKTEEAPIVEPVT